MLHYNRRTLKCYITTEQHENVTLQQNNMKMLHYNIKSYITTEHIKMLHYNRTTLKCYITTEHGFF